ncbi:MAG: hypothetical protein IT317_22795 [Anaerolineales bacterium]|nr:hypothetical protein [Anaerolineales bacterium]
MQIFIGGSREITSLDAAVQTRLNNVVEQGYTVLIGDAAGADQAVQQYLLAKAYPTVVVYCTGGQCRHNLGQWPVKLVTPPHATKDFAYFAAKDTAMAEAADYGLMLWNGQSAGTLRNVLNLLKRGRTTLVYLAAQFHPLTSAADLQKLLAHLPAHVRAALDRKINLSKELAALTTAPALSRQLDLLP